MTYLVASELPDAPAGTRFRALLERAGASGSRGQVISIYRFECDNDISEAFGVQPRMLPVEPRPAWLHRVNARINTATATQGVALQPDTPRGTLRHNVARCPQRQASHLHTPP